MAKFQAKSNTLSPMRTVIICCALGLCVFIAFPDTCMQRRENNAAAMALVDTPIWSWHICAQLELLFGLQLNYHLPNYNESCAIMI